MLIENKAVRYSPPSAWNIFQVFEPYHLDLMKFCISKDNFNLLKPKSMFQFIKLYYKSVW